MGYAYGMPQPPAATEVFVPAPGGGVSPVPRWKASTLPSGCSRPVSRVALAFAAALSAACSAGGRTAAAVVAQPADASGLAPHPRLFLSPDLLRRLRAKAARGDADWMRLRSGADRLSRFAIAPYDREAGPPRTIAYRYQGLGWLEAITSLGLAYQVTGDKAYARKVVELLHAINATTAASNLEPIKVDSGFPSRSAALGVALAFDWIYPELDAQTRAATVLTVNRWFDWYAAEALDRDGPAVSNYFGGHLLGFGAAGVATSGDNDRAPEIVAHLRRRFDAVVAPAIGYDGPLAGGFPFEGYVYGANHYKRLLHFMELTGDPPASPGQRAEFAERVARNLIHAVGPGRWRVPVEADYPGDVTGVLNPELPLLLAHILAGRPLGASIHDLVASRGSPPSGSDERGSELDWLLYWDRERSTAGHRAGPEPPFLHSPGDEHLFMRSGWSRDAVWASFNGGLTILSPHQARAAGHFAVQRGDDSVLVYAGQWKGKDGLVGQPHRFETTSAYANTLFVDDGGAYLYPGDRYLGGQGYWATTRPFPFAQDADWTWAKLDATSIYDRKPGSQDASARSVRQFVRNFIYLSPGTFVVFDRIRMLMPGYVKSVRFHLGGTDSPRLSGNLATSTVGASALHVRTLLPRDPAITVAWNEVAGVRLNPRLEVTAKTPGVDLDVLTVLSAQDRRAPPPEALLVAEDGGAMIGAQVKAPPGAHRVGGAAGSSAIERVVLFAAAPTGALSPMATLRYRVATAGPSRHHLLDLPPEKPYRVQVTGSGQAAGGVEVTVSPAGSPPNGPPGATTSSSRAGALVFDLVAGKIVAR